MPTRKRGAPTLIDQIDRLKEQAGTEKVRQAEDLTKRTDPLVLSLAFKLMKRCANEFCNLRVPTLGAQLCRRCKEYESLMDAKAEYEAHKREEKRDEKRNMSA